MNPGMPKHNPGLEFANAFSVAGRRMNPRQVEVTTAIIKRRLSVLRISKLSCVVIHDLPVVAILITVISDLFTVLQSEVNCQHVISVRV